MRILYHNPTSGSGIEQVGYVFLLLLKKLGHEIDFWNTQCANLQETRISKTINDYDAVVLNSAYEISFKRMIKEPTDKVFNISHNGATLPEFCKQLSLNYVHQYQFLFDRNRSGIMFPITYPYAHRKNIFNNNRPHKFMFVGRWFKQKFDPKVKEIMESRGMKIDAAFINYKDPDYDYRNLIREVRENSDLREVEEYMRNTEYLLLPSTTECISLVAGEALVNGCIPVVLDVQKDEHKQFFNCIISHSPENFGEVVAALGEKGGDPEGTDRGRIFSFANKMWSIDKTLEELRVIFGKGNKGSINVMYNEHPYMPDVMPYVNATLITGEHI